MKKLILTVLAMSLLISCKDQKSPIQEKVDEYAIFEVSSPLMDKLSDKDKQVLNLFRQAGNIIDGLFWEQTFGDKSLMELRSLGQA